MVAHRCNPNDVGRWKNLIIGGTLFLVASLAGFAAWNMRSSLVQYRQEATGQAELAAAAAGRSIVNQCSVLRGSDYSACAAEKVDVARQRRLGAYELEAQRQVSRWTFWLVISGFLQLAITAVGLLFIRGQLKATKDAVVVAEKAISAETRPWIKVTATAIALEMRDEVPTVTLTFKLKNVGGTPTPNVAIFVTLTDVMFGLIQEEQIKFADKCRNEPLGGWFPNFSLFPDDEANLTHTLSLSTEQFQALKERFSAMQAQTMRLHLPLSAIGCAQYRFVGSNEPHQTGFAYHLQKVPTPTMGQAIFLEQLPLSADELWLQNDYEGSGRID